MRLDVFFFENRLMITGTWMEKENYLMDGWSRGRLTWKRTISRPDNVWPDMWRNQSSIKPDSHVVSSSLNPMMKNSDASSKMLVVSWKFRCQQQCLVKHHQIAAVKPAAVLVKANPIHFYCLCRRNFESTIGRCVAQISTEITILQKGKNSLRRYNLEHKFIPMLEAVKIPDAKAAVAKEWGNIDGPLSSQEFESLSLNFKCTKEESCSEVTLRKMIQDHVQGSSA